jgi:hypothetical protein
MRGAIEPWRSRRVVRPPMQKMHSQAEAGTPHGVRGCPPRMQKTDVFGVPQLRASGDTDAHRRKRQKGRSETPRGALALSSGRGARTSAKVRCDHCDGLARSRYGNRQEIALGFHRRSTVPRRNQHPAPRIRYSATAAPNRYSYRGAVLCSLGGNVGSSGDCIFTLRDINPPVIPGA